MALTYGNPTVRTSIGARYEVVVPITLDSSYPTGGYAVTGTSLGLPCGLIDTIDCNTSPDSGYDVRYNYTTGNIQAFATGASSGAALAEVTNATNLSTVTATAVVHGR